MQPAYSPDCYFLWIIDKEMSMAVEVCNKKSENNINGKEAIDDVVNDEKSIIFLVS